MFLAELDIRKLRLRSDPLVRAFAYSLVFHFCLFGTIEVGMRLGLWHASFLPSWLSSSKNVPAISDLQAQQALRNLTSEPPLLFVQVEPEQSSAQAPKDAKFYAAVNSTAANPKVEKESKDPKIDGSQTKVIKTVEAPKPKPVEKIPEPIPEPAPPKQQKVEPDILQPLPKANNDAGDTEPEKPAKSSDTQSPAVGTESAATKPTRPRTLTEAMLRKGVVPGEKVKQDGGVKRRASIATIDAKATPFGAYDDLVVTAIQKRWFDLLDEHTFAMGRTGKVILDFTMHSDGRVGSMVVREETVGMELSLLCQRAVQDPAPFPPWPDEMKRMIGRSTRPVRFTFYYD